MRFILGVASGISTAKLPLGLAEELAHTGATLMRPAGDPLAELGCEMICDGVHVDRR